MKIIEYHNLAEEYAWLTSRSVNFSPVAVSRILSFIKNQPNLNKYIPYFYEITSENSLTYFMGSQLMWLFNEPGFYDLAAATLIAPNLFNWYEQFLISPNNNPFNQYAIDTLISILSPIPEFSGFLQSLNGITPENSPTYNLAIKEIFKTPYIVIQSLAQIIPDEENRK